MSNKGSKSEESINSSFITTKNGIFDYRGCLFEVRLQKKGLFGQNTRYVYCTPDSIVIAKEAYQKKPEMIIKLQSNWKVVWIYDPKKLKEAFENKIQGFRLLTGTETKIEFYGDILVMTTLRDFFSKQIFQLKFLDEFEIQKKIGKGKYAKVYKVRRKDNNKYYAVKYLHKNKLATIEDAQRALFNELKILRIISHPNCVNLEATYEDDNGYYILTELLDSEKSLQFELTKFSNPQFGYHVVRHILQQLLSGIDYVHSLGIMHRDLKPQNIMFATSNGSSLQNLKIIDFGLAQFLNDPNYIYVHVGTPGYVAPEILANESDKHRYSEKCDLFSIGVVFHILLTGRSVFPGKRFSQVLKSNKECKIDLSSQRYDELNKDAVDLLLKLLDPNPVKRLSAREALQHQFFLVDSYKEKNNKISSAQTLETSAESSGIGLSKSNSKDLQDASYKVVGKLGRGFQNLKKLASYKDLDSIQFNFEDLHKRMKSVVVMSKVDISTSNQSKYELYKLAFDIVEIFIVLEDNQDDDLSFFASPLKVKKQEIMRNGLNKSKSINTDQEDDALNKIIKIEKGAGDQSFGQTNAQNDNNNKQQINQDLVQEKIQVLSKDQPCKIDLRRGEGEREEDDEEDGNEEFNGEKPVEDEEEEKRDVVEDLLKITYKPLKSENGLDKEESTVKQFPKRLMHLLNLFPQELLEKEMEGNLKKEGKAVVKLLGKFLLLGYRESVVTDQDVFEELNKVRSVGVIHQLLIDTVTEMLNVNLDLVPHFLYLKTQLEKLVISENKSN